MGQARHHLLLPAGVGAEQLFDLLAQVRNVPAEATSGPVEIDAVTTLYGPDLGVDGGSEWRFVTESVRGAVMDFDDETHGLFAAFPHGLPEGSEARVVDLVLALARRLHGQTRFDADTNTVILTPGPCVEHTVWAADPVDVATVIRLIAEVMPTASVPGYDDAFLGLAPAQEPDLQLTDDEHAEIHAAALRTDAAALAADDDSDGYAVIGEVGAELFAIEVHPNHELPPPTVGDRRWCYDVRWSPADDEVLLEVFPAGSLFEETEQARDVVQSLALRLVEALDGVITDADGFLVDRYSLG